VRRALPWADIQALISCHELDVWLAAHLGDIFDKLAMIPDDEERFETSLRDYFILEYAELLQFNPKYSALWRIICDYLAAAGDEGRNRLHTHILHVSLGFDAKRKNKETESTAMEEAGIESQFRHFTEVREACIELKLDEEWRTISKIMTDRLVRKGDYGLAATMCLQAEDGHALSRIAEKILDAYLDQGEDEFLRLVDTLPPSLLSEAPAALAQLQNDPTSALPFDLSGQMAVSVFASRLTFLSELRDYLLFMSQGAKDRAAMRLVNLLTSGIAPAGFWAVLLVESVGLLEGMPFLWSYGLMLTNLDHEILFTSNDSFELLRVLQEVVSSSTFAPNEYLSQLAQYLRRKEGIAGNTKNGTALARRKMEEVRLALARNLARALVVGFDNPF